MRLEVPRAHVGAPYDTIAAGTVASKPNVDLHAMKRVRGVQQE